MNANSVKVPTGQQIAMVVFDPPREGDCISQSVMQELIRRMHVFTLDPTQQIVRSVEAPTNKTVYWLPVDSQGNVAGLLQGYDPATGTWVDVSSVGACISQDPTSILQVDGNGCLIVSAQACPGYAEPNDHDVTPTAGAATIDVSYENFIDIDAEISVLFMSDPGSGSRWWLTNLADTGCTVNFAGLTGPLTVRIIARRSVLT